VSAFLISSRFKSINDNLGHHAGDIVLKRTAKEIRKSLRDSDVFARFGGEEFVLLVTGADLRCAAIAADRIRKTMHTIDFSDIASTLSVTLSGGVAQYRPKEEIRAILSRADKSLYMAKSSGRDCIKVETVG
jgi:diguanylate cyclase